MRWNAGGPMVCVREHLLAGERHLDWLACRLGAEAASIACACTGTFEPKPPPI